MAISSKRVHFPETPVTRSYSPRPEPRTPSPSWSDNSLPDDGSGPSTPPSTASFAASLPNVSKSRDIAHPLLAFNDRTRMTALVWDAATPSSYAAQRKGKGKEISRLLPADTATAATHPHTSYMEIYISGLPCWKPITLGSLDASPSSSPSRAVTVADVLDGVYEYLQHGVRRNEYESFPPELQNGVSMAFYNRCKAMEHAAGKAEAERAQKAGLRRIDVLVGRTQFVALVPLSRNVWQVVLAPPS